eukprot:6205674-Pleurochrysis_carterae.AAC.2
MINTQLGTVGCRMRHDIFGLCTHIDDASVAPGSFKVRIDADGSVKELTKGHFQFDSAVAMNLSAGGSNENAKAGGCSGAGGGAAQQVAAADKAEQGGTHDTPGEGDGIFEDKSNKPTDCKEQEEEGGGDDDTAFNNHENDMGDDINGTGTNTDGGQPPAEGESNAGEGESNAGEGESNAGKGELNAGEGDSEIFVQVIEAMKEQHSKYGLEANGLALAWLAYMLKSDANVRAGSGHDGRHRRANST